VSWEIPVEVLVIIIKRGVRGSELDWKYAHPSQAVLFETSPFSGVWSTPYVRIGEKALMGASMLFLIWQKAFLRCVAPVKIFTS